MTSILKNVYSDKLDNIVNSYDNTSHNKTDVKSRAYIDSSKEIHDKDSKFKVGDIVRISKYEIIFAKGYVPS